jgi:precorrin-2 dehydrogenase / sirohydrochlorin ferrochelatase
MKYYPVNLDVRNRPCVVVGGGSVGTRKVLTLLDCGARVTVVSLDLSPELRLLAKGKKLKVIQRPYESSDLDQAFLVIGATDKEDLNQRIHTDAEKRNLLCNIADKPASCNFILPSILCRGDLVVTVSTSGSSPAYAKHLRHVLENLFGEEQAIFLRLMGKIREKLLREKHEPEFHKPIFEKLTRSDLVEKIQRKDTAGIDTVLFSVLGEGYTYNGLMDEDTKGISVPSEDIT